MVNEGASKQAYVFHLGYFIPGDISQTSSGMIERIRESIDDTNLANMVIKSSLIYLNRIYLNRKQDVIYSLFE